MVRNDPNIVVDVNDAIKKFPIDHLSCKDLVNSGDTSILMRGKTRD